MRQRLSTGIRGALHTLRLHTLARRLYRQRLLIVCYHGVTADPVPADGPAWHLLPAEEFRAQLAYLQRHYNVLPLDDAITALRAGRLRRPTAAITFDDGYLNNWTVALPILREMALPATVFLTTGLIDTDGEIWTIEVERRVRAADASSIAPFVTEAPAPTQADRGALAAAIVARLKTMPAADRARELAGIRTLRPAPADVPSAFRMMSWNDARAMEESGLVSIGAHTVHHEILATLPDEAVDAEVRTSVEQVAAHVHRPSRTFAYPNGRPQDFDARAVAAARAAGLEAALTTVPGLNARDDDPFRLRRVVVGGTMKRSDFELETSGLMDVVRNLLPGRRRASAARL